MTTTEPVALAERPPPVLPQLAPPRLSWPRRHPVVAAMAVAGTLHLLWWRFLATSGGDLAAQDYWAAFARHYPGSAYSLEWYGGLHPVNYSVISPYIMAWIGVRPTMVLAGTLSAGLLALLLHRFRTVTDPWWPSLYAAVLLTGDAVSGRATFALGTVFGLAVLAVLFVWPTTPRWDRPQLRRWVRGPLAALMSLLATAVSPVAGLFVGLVAVALWLRRRRAAALAVGLPPLAVVAATAVLFPFSGEEPMAWTSAILPSIIGLCLVVLVPSGWRTVRLGAGVYVTAVVLCWLLPTPIGTNITRLGLLFGGVLLVAVVTEHRLPTSLAARRLGVPVARVLLVGAVLTSTIWQVAFAANDAVHSAPPPALNLDIHPLVNQLHARDAELGRVEVVPTRSHREASALAPYVNLARGWNRQADVARNALFYTEGELTVRHYRQWLHRWAVRFVVLPSAPPDPAATEESALVAAGAPYLKEVWADASWRLFEVKDPTPLVSDPATVLDFDSARMTIYTPRAGAFVVRVASSPWLSLVNSDGEPYAVPDEHADLSEVACLSSLSKDDGDGDDTGIHQRPVDWLVLHAPTAGTYRIAAPYKIPRGTACPEAP